MKQAVVALLLILATAGAWAGEARRFVPGSMASIQARFAGRSFILALWSLTCTHCSRELKLLGKLARADHDLPLVLVATDTPADAAQITTTQQRYGLGKVESWVFADPVPERLRYEIDPVWYSELPRTYLFDAAHRRVAHSGLMNEKQLRAWLHAQRREH